MTKVAKVGFSPRPRRPISQAALLSLTNTSRCPRTYHELGFPESPRPSVDGDGKLDLADFEERGDDASNSLQMLVNAVDHDVVEFTENPIGRLKARA